MEQANRIGRKRKNVNFNPSKEYLEKAKDEFKKGGGRATVLPGNYLEYYYKPYCSDKMLGMDSLPIEFL